MRIKHSGFTFIEVLIAISLSAYILYGLTRLYQTVVRQVAFTQNISHMQRAVFLVLYQMRTDLSTAFVPESLPRDDKDKEKEAASKEQTSNAPAGTSKDKESVQLKEKYKNMFLLTTEEHDEPVKIDGARRHRVKLLSFVTTNPLHVYDQKRQRLVRVVYELVRNKAASSFARDVFNLVRKESLDIMNFSGKDVEQSFVVAENLKGFYAECSLFKKDIPPKEEDKKEGQKDDVQKEAEKEIDPKERVTSATWGDKAALQGFVPQSITCWLEFWDGTTPQSLLFSQAVSIVSYPSIRGSLQAPPPPEPPVVEQANAEQAKPDDASVIKLSQG
jgi:prepilin-type N-terminal cleavage/methylation domain-containing protein